MLVIVIYLHMATKHSFLYLRYHHRFATPHVHDERQSYKGELSLKVSFGGLPGGGVFLLQDARLANSMQGRTYQLM